MMVMMVMATGPTGRLSQVLEVRELTILGGRRKVRRQRGQCVCCVSIPVCLCGLRSGRQVGGDGRRHLLVFGWVRLLQLLQRARNLSERRKLAVVRLGRGGLYSRHWRVTALVVVYTAEGGVENLLQVGA
jgi:hypothetical protein